MDINWLSADYLPWLILAFPLVSFLVIALFTARNAALSQAVALAGIGIAWVLSMIEFAHVVWIKDIELGKSVVGSQLEWMDIGAYTFKVGVMVDPLTAYMLLMVPLACLLIFIYSLGYMHGDPRVGRFFGYLSLFSGGMLTLVLADNLLLLFIGWEIMGFCSYSLIGFWAHKKTAMEAGVKAFMTTRVADMLMLVGIGFLFVLTAAVNPNGPTLNFRELMYDPQPEIHAETAEAAASAEAEAPAEAAAPAEGELPMSEAPEGALAETHAGGEDAEAGHGEEHRLTLLDSLADRRVPIFGGSAVAFIGVMLVIGTIGKSAQFPLHVWLPDAMEGPTPVSAMIHAAAMVSAGVYMVIRMFPLLSAGADYHAGDFSAPMVLMGLVGGFTALFAAVLGMGQSDIKRVLAYSTISQLGYMVAALGVGAWIAAAFHLINHAFFKALLFMASGSVIHAMEHGEHHAHEHGHGDHEHHEEPDGLVMDYVAPPNDMRRMGGLIHRIPVTAITMAIGGLSLAGFPFVTAGFWSKDEIIAEAWHGMTEGFPLALFVLLMLVVSAALTAFYTARMWFLTFWGQPRTEAARYAGPGTLRPRWVSWWNSRKASASYKLINEYADPSTLRAAAQMEAPLVILAFFAITAGFIGIHEDILGKNPLHDFLAATVALHGAVIDFNFVPMLVSIIVALSGLVLGYLVYGARPLAAGQDDPVKVAVGPEIWRMLENRFYIDLLYRKYLVKPVERFAHNVVGPVIDQETIDGVLETISDLFTGLGELFKMLNKLVIDGVGDGIPRAIGAFGGWLRQSQSGKLQQYLLVVALAVLALGTLLIIQVR